MKLTEHNFKAPDGAELFYRAWRPAKPATRALLLFHRGHEHSARWEETVAELGLEEFAVFAWDARGHGRSPGARGSADNLGVITGDVEAFVQHVSAQESIPINRMAVLAHSVGAVTVTAWVHDYAPPIRALVLAAPAFRVKLYLPFAVALLRLKQKFFGPGFVKSYVKAKMLTHDPEQAAAYGRDPLIFRQIAVNILLDLHDASTRLLADAAAITVPTLLFVAGKDWVVKPAAQETFFHRLGSTIKHLVTLPGFRHAIFHERERRVVVARTREFILECFKTPARGGSLIEADKQGFTKDEYDRLRGPGSFRFAVTAWGMKKIGSLSRGVKLGWQAGFNSGRMLDYVYENTAQGITPLGRAFDRAYLGSVGWRGIRLRKVNLQMVLRQAMEDMHAQGRAVRVLDIASGPGRYVIETARELARIPVTLRLRDIEPVNIEAARRLAVAAGLKDFGAEIGDAFDRASLAAVRPRPTIAIVSGLYELFPANGPVLESLRGLADAMEPGGLLIYTNQPWHPQLEFIARVLTNRDGRPWIMRRRTQAEMDELVRAAGFEKLQQRIDQWGIFSVSLARRMNP